MDVDNEVDKMRILSVKQLDVPDAFATFAPVLTEHFIYYGKTCKHNQGDVDSYLMIQSLAGQNHLLQELHSHPRYIQDSEWTELERVLRNSFSSAYKVLIFLFTKFGHFWSPFWSQLSFI